METLVKADIFFFITSVSIVFITVVVLWGLFYVLRILRNVKNISDEAVMETKRVVEDIGELREDLKREGTGLIQKVSFFSRFFNNVTKSKKVRKTQHAKKEANKED